ncbi:DUF1579 family protein [Pontixanthobacter aestiaquae]|uniref:DUF1579 domain-containing protein n=1 Tax=Pontixanthobacter aestiaquae TaxID=1509367 RepID=A0A844ZA65_9SPHN|nr:DUF1579 family protein [Pontixanthobacter aestiaquae]MDN3645248.1 DUF1579 family protein [Pontixanthobacter aestiaquae]MXO83750.1 DUF1579 domain-containing protein [Pontixanthobacter aestiaquae]
MLVSFLALILAQDAATQTGAPPPPAVPPTASCKGENYDAFNFWVGDWDVYVTGAETQEDGSPRVVAQSTIEKLYNGCAIRENWMPARPSPGGSLSGYNPKTGMWEQTWIGSSPGQVYFKGGGGRTGMVLTGLWPNVGGPGRDGLIRMTYTPNELDGSVRQLGQVSYDEGVTWAPSFDFTYRPKADAGQKDTE